MHFHLAMNYAELPLGFARYDGKEQSLLDFVTISNQLFGNVDGDTRISLEECNEALEYKPRALFVGWGFLRIMWFGCDEDKCFSPLMN